MSTPPPPAPPMALHRMAIFTPGRQSDDEIRASFIARQDVLDRILEDIRATRAGSIPQHHLLIGQRGMGKTTMLRRLHVALREQPLAQSFIPLGFPEEQYSVDRLSTVFLNCLDALADTLEQENGSEAIIIKIDEAVERLRKDRAAEEIVAQDAERTLLYIAAEIGRRPVLLVDNLGLIFERLKKPELHQFRAFLMKNSAPIIIGASAQMLDQDYAAPFYDHFKTHPLGRLSYEDMRDVILRLAERTGNTDIPARIDQESGRLHALHALTGGNPRTTRILFDVFSHGFSQEAYQDLEMLLDWMTPLYKARFEELSPQAQIVVSSIATMWEPVVLSRICEATRLQANQISPQLDRLKKADVIEEVTVDPPDRTGPIPEQRTPRDRTGYQITERFFNIWFLMRQATRRDKRNLIYLTRFIECLHSAGEREQFAQDLLDQPALSKSQKIYALALEQAIQDRHLKLRLHDHVESEFIKAHRQKIEELEDILDLAEIPPHRWEFAELRERLIQAVPKDSPITPEKFADVILGVPLFVSRREEIACRKLPAAEVTQLVDEAKANVHSLTELVPPGAVEWFSSLLRNGIVIDVRDPAHMSAAILRADTPEKMEMCLLVGEAAKNLHEVSDEAFDAVSGFKAPQEGSRDASAWVSWGKLCHQQFKRYAAALSAYRGFVSIRADVLEAWELCASLLEMNEAPHEEILEACAKATELGSEEPSIWNRYGILLAEKGNQSSAADAAFRRAIELKPDEASPWFRLGLLQEEQLGQFQKAEGSYRKAIDLEPSNPLYWRCLGDLLVKDSKRKPDAEEAFRKALEFDPLDQLAAISLAKLVAKKKGGREEAEALLTKTVSDHPDSSYAKGRLAEFIGEQKHRHIEAIDLWLDLAKEHPSNSAALASIAAWLRKHGDKDTARTLFNRALQFSSISTLLAVVREKLNDGKMDAMRDMLGIISNGLLEQREGVLDLDYAILAAHDENWGQASALIRSLIERLGDRAMFPREQQDDWITLSAALLHYGYGEKLLELLADTGADQKLRPWSEAIRAHLRGDAKYLRNAPVEVRDAAKVLFGAIQSKLTQLPESTRRWESPSTSRKPRVGR
ncbi:MAG: tetratricopeptide repeat protein [Verrucomicrobiaceae bacterium]|nr:tetratricopeptide repeat protein [Verrucomicrobiaceae bacterium]